MSFVHFTKILSITSLIRNVEAKITGKLQRISNWFLKNYLISSLPPKKAYCVSFERNKNNIRKQVAKGRKFHRLLHLLIFYFFIDFDGNNNHVHNFFFNIIKSTTTCLDYTFFLCLFLRKGFPCADSIVWMVVVGRLTQTDLFFIREFL